MNTDWLPGKVRIVPAADGFGWVVERGWNCLDTLVWSYVSWCLTRWGAERVKARILRREATA